MVAQSFNTQKTTIFTLNLANVATVSIPSHAVLSSYLIKSVRERVDDLMLSQTCKGQPHIFTISSKMVFHG